MACGRPEMTIGSYRLLKVVTSHSGWNFAVQSYRFCKEEKIEISALFFRGQSTNQDLLGAII